MVNDKGVPCITGYNNLGNATKAACIKREGNDKGVPCITGCHNLGNKGAEAHAENARASALGEHHSHICTSALCQRGASIKWEGGLPRMYHHCYNPDNQDWQDRSRDRGGGLCYTYAKNATGRQWSARRLAAWHQHAATTASCYAKISTKLLFRNSIINSNSLFYSSSHAAVRHTIAGLPDDFWAHTSPFWALDFLIYAYEKRGKKGGISSGCIMLWCCVGVGVGDDVSVGVGLWVRVWMCATRLATVCQSMMHRTFRIINLFGNGLVTRFFHFSYIFFRRASRVSSRGDFEACTKIRKMQSLDSIFMMDTFQWLSCVFATKEGKKERC